MSRYVTYTLYEGVIPEKVSSVKKLVIGVIASLGVASLFAIPAFAASNSYCGSSSNGCSASAAAGAQCGTGAGSGAFGAFGPGSDWRGGANGYQTGINNSALCGNRQSN